MSEYLAFLMYTNSKDLLSFWHHLESFLAWSFILNDFFFWLTISYKKPFCFCVLFSNIYSKTEFTVINWSGLCNFYSKVIFLNFCLRKYFLLSFSKFKLLIFHNNIMKISEKLNKQNLLKICFQVTYPSDFFNNLHSFLLWEKVKIFIFF